MSKKFIAGLLVGALIGAAGLSVAQSPAPVLADFRIEISVTPAANGVDMECTKGCAWEELSFACEQGAECSSPINALGMAE
jgi:hypothetical protein